MPGAAISDGCALLAQMSESDAMAAYGKAPPD